MRERVLVVDDEPSMRRLFRAMLDEAGYAVDCVGTTHEAESALTTQDYGGILLDYQLPGEDGLAFVCRVAPVRPLPPILVVTGQDLWPLQQRALPPCVKVILPKPLDLQTLFTMASQHFGPPAPVQEAGQP
jgi:DNA-binding response OmpR family regulator